MRIKQATDAVHARLRERLAERERIARELHDTLLQGFHGLALRLGVTVQMVPQTEPVHAMLEDAMKRVDEVLVEGRRGVNDLRAQQNIEGDIATEFEQTFFSLGFPDSVDCKVVIAGNPTPLYPRVHFEISAIGREALTNAFRHSMCSSVRVEIQFHKQNLFLLVMDDGKGISSTIQAAGRRVGHWGLAGMRERATSLGGTLDVISNESDGTTIRVAVPSQKAYSHPQTVPFWHFRKKFNGDSPTSRD